MRQRGMRGPHENHLSRALGLDRNVDIDVVVDKPQPQDLYLLCTDGLTKMVSDARILEVLLTEQDLESAVYALIEQANDAGGKDNVSVILLRYTE